MYNDTVSDFFTRLRNASMSGKMIVPIRGSKLIAAIADTLKSEGFIESYTKDGDKFEVTLSESAPMSHIKRLSRPSIRRYVSYNDIPKPKSGLGTVIVSTPKGILTGKQARKQKVGGELICEVW